MVVFFDSRKYRDRDVSPLNFDLISHSLGLEILIFDWVPDLASLPLPPQNFVYPPLGESRLLSWECQVSSIPATIQRLAAVRATLPPLLMASLLLC